MTPLFPLFLKLEQETCLVVGGGALALQKAKALVRSGALLRVVAPEVHDELASLTEDRGGELHRRGFETADVEGTRLVIAATSDEETNRAVAEAARARGILVNVVDVVPLCDFYTGGIVERGPLQVVIGTSGASPSMARQTRLWLEGQLPEALGPITRKLGEVRPHLLQRHPDFRARASLLDGFVRARFAEAHAADGALKFDEVALEQAIERELLGPGVVRATLGENGLLTELVLSDVAFAEGEVDLSALGREEMALASDYARAWLDDGDTAAAADLAELGYALVKL